MAFVAENALEMALVGAVKDPLQVPAFYRLLLECELLVLGTAKGLEEATEKFVLEPGERLDLVTGFKDGSTFLPVFSSLPRMQDYVKQVSKYLTINGRALLELTRGTAVVLNPASEYGKELSAEQVAQLLGHASNRPARTLVGEADYPAPLVEALTAIFLARPEIDAAWMIRVTFADRPDQPHPLVGVEFGKAGGDWHALMQAVQTGTQALAMVFDIQRIDRDHPHSLTDALLQVPPFYRRGKAQPTLN